MKTVVLSMDVEDWYHLDYFRQKECDRAFSMLDGVSVYRDLLAEMGVPSSFFVLGELIAGQSELLRSLDREGHDVSVHGWGHDRPLLMAPEEFDRDIRRCKVELENVLGHAVEGYRAPCFSLDRPRLDLIQAAGFNYDSSRIQFDAHPLYGAIDMSGYRELAANVYRKDNFYEFQVSTFKLAGKNLPVSGGGYLRIFPWRIMRPLIRSYLKTGALYVLYIHPFELSPRANPPFPPGARWRSRIRFSLGRTSGVRKLKALIELLKQHDYRFATFSALHKELSLTET